MSEPTLEQIEAFNRNETEELGRLLGPLCEERGYGRLMQIIEGLWAKKDPRGWHGPTRCMEWVRAAEAQLAECRQVLRDVEWAAVVGGIGTCPSCGRLHRFPSHAPDCRLAKALGEGL